MTTTTCQFLDPVNLGNNPPDWEFSKMNCISTIENPNIYSLVENTETGAEFFVEKTLTYGEAMILWFLTLFTFYFIFKITYNFFWKK